LFLPSLSHGNEQNVRGVASIVDGDTLDIGEERVRLEGIDTPEPAQKCLRGDGTSWPCGAAATKRLRQLVGSVPVECKGSERDERNRLIATCFVAGRDLNSQLVREGLAWAFVKYSDTYVREEREARSERRGVFEADNTPPWKFREDRWNSATGSAEVDAARECPIKGNVNGGGECIYHMPWQRDYAKVKINTAKGERWFCNDAEAERAGCRPAKQ
jgi:endonuclease YncB( thermonuclease family)